ncbi:MAG: ankyrin repeat domain-containing protein [Sedimentisphaerales bacterium]|nr:ankyrin repeat domain-containing protein [Sedimentisphaerales bacterium]
MKKKYIWHLILIMILFVNFNTSKSEESTELLNAIERGNSNLAKKLIIEGANPNTKSEFDNCTALHIASETGDLEIAELLIENGAKVNAIDIEGETPLHKSCYYLQMLVTELLLKNGANSNAKNVMDITPLHMAINFNSDAMIAIDDIIDRAYPGVGPNSKRYIELEEVFIEKFMMRITELLIASGADVNAKDIFGGTPLLDAITYAPEIVIKTLLENGANPNTEDEYGTTVLQEAVANNFNDIVDLLIEYKADVNVTNINGDTVLHEAVWNNHQTIAEKLITKGANVNAKNNNGDTPLHIAGICGYTELYNLLITKDANDQLTNKQDKKPVDYLNSPIPKDAVMISGPEDEPYSVIVTNLKAIRKFLKNEVNKYDRIWIPEKKDIEGLKIQLKSFIENKIKENPSDNALSYIRDNIDDYNCEYTGFAIDGKTYVICNMILNIETNPKDNEFTFIYDGGSTLINVIYDLNNKTVDQVKSSYP